MNGSTAGNLYNGGLFCEYDGTVYFSNPSDGGKLYSGRGISTDIVGASIRAYLNALNKIVYREK